MLRAMRVKAGSFRLKGGSNVRIDSTHPSKRQTSEECIWLNARGLPNSRMLDNHDQRQSRISIFPLYDVYLPVYQLH